MTIPENTQQSNPKDDGIFLDGKNIFQRDTTTMTLVPRDPADSDNNTTIIAIVVGAAIIAIGAAVYIGRLLYKQRSKGIKDLENRLEVIPIMEMEPPPKKTAADHLEEIKGITQKAFKLGNLSTFSLSDAKESNTSNSASSKSQAEPSTSNASGSSSLKNVMSKKKVPPPPPPSPLKSQHNDIDDIETEPIRMSLLDALLLDSLTSPTHEASPSQLSSVNPSSRSARRPSVSLVANSRTLSQQTFSLPPRLSSQASRDRLKPRKSKQNMSKYVITSKEKDEPIQGINDTNEDINDVNDVNPTQIAQSEITPVYSSNSS